MKLRIIFGLEFRYQIRRPATWLYFAAVCVLSFLFVVGNFAPDAREGYFLLNAPVVIATVTILSIVHWLPIGASIAGDAAIRDVQTRMHFLTYTAPSSKTAYLGGHFLAAYALNVIILLGIPLGILVALYGSGVEPEILGPDRAASYLSPFLILVLPNAFIATAIQFSLASLIRRTSGSYLGAALLFVVSYALWLQKPGAWTHLADPMSFTSVMEYTSILSPLEKRTRLLLPEGILLLNRLLWIGISAGLLLLTYFRFRFTFRERGKGRTRYGQGEQNVSTSLAPNREIGEALPRLRGSFGLATQLYQLRIITRNAFSNLAGSAAGLPQLAFLAAMMGLAMPGNLKAKGVPLTPRTDRVVDLLTAPITEPEIFWIIIALLTIYYAGELVWRERDTGLSELAHAAPVPEWVLFSSRFLALSLLLVIWLAFLMIAGIGVQTAIGGSYPEFGLYLQALFGLQLVDCLLFAILTIAVHVLVNQKYIAHLVALAAYGLIVYAPKLGLEHRLLTFGSAPPWAYTDMAGYGSSIGPWLWFKAYWLAWALLLAAVVRLFWVRGRDRSFISRLRLARKRFTPATAVASSLAAAGVILTGGFIFYNTNVLNDYRSSSEMKEQRAAYEQRYRKFLDVPQPVLSGVRLQVDIRPRQLAVNIKGSYLLVNATPGPIDSIHLAIPNTLRTSGIGFDRPFRELLADNDLGHRIYALTQPLLPGDSLRLRFLVTHKARGFSNGGADTQVLCNGTSFRNYEWLPAIGYQSYLELDEPGLRKAYGLASRPVSPSLYDTGARRYAIFPEQIRFEAVVATDTDQTAVAPGQLLRTWTKSGRRYFHYAAGAPIRNEYSIFSARYAVQEGAWKPLAANPGSNVSIQIYYPPGPGGNPERMVRSAQASLDYYSAQFGSYPYRELRFVTHASDRFGHHAAPVNITAEEGFYLLNPKDDPQGFDLVTATVAHEVAHQWWGNMLRQASVEGAGLITESLAWYSAMGVLEDSYGPESLRRLLSFLREASDIPRSRAALPLLQAGDWYHIYRKGPLALYTLSQYIGRDQVNRALRALLSHHRPGNLPRPTSLDLYGELQAVTPDSLRPLLHDLFGANTFWELELERATSKQIGKDSWKVTIGLKANKQVVDSAGIETMAPMNDWVEVGIYSGTGKDPKAAGPLYLQKHRVRSGRQTIVLTVHAKPATAGIDPRQLLTDLNGEDIFKTVSHVN